MTKFWAITFMILNVFIFQVDAYVEIKSLDVENVERVFEEKMQRTDTFLENASNDKFKYAPYVVKIDMLGGQVEVFLSPRASLSLFIKEHLEQLRDDLASNAYLGTEYGKILLN